MNDTLAPVGRPLALNVTAELNPFDGVTVTLYVVPLPAVTVWLDGVAPMVKSPAGLRRRVTEVECVVVLVPVIVTVALPIGVVLLVVTVIVEEPLEVIDGGLNVAVAPAGKPLAFSVTVPVYPPDPIIVTV